MWWEELKLQLYQTFVQDGNYMYFVRGIGITLLVTVLALVMGIVIGLALHFWLKRRNTAKAE